MSSFLKKNLIIIYILLFLGFLTGGVFSLVAIIYTYILHDKIKKPLDFTIFQQHMIYIWIIFFLSMVPFLVFFLVFPDTILNYLVL